VWKFKERRLVENECKELKNALQNSEKYKGAGKRNYRRMGICKKAAGSWKLEFKIKLAKLGIKVPKLNLYLKYPEFIKYMTKH